LSNCENLVPQHIASPKLVVATASTQAAKPVRPSNP
jgi:hypothetical protein